MRYWSIVALALLGATPASGFQAEAEPNAEAALLSGHLQLTDAAEFAKAGEAYFSHDGSRVIFQAVPAPEGDQKQDPHYSMYVADVRRDGAGMIVGLGPTFRLSAPGSANTCGWFHPSDPSRVLFGSTLVPPSEEDQPGYQRGTGRYAWQFPREMEIVEARLPDELHAMSKVETTPLFERDGYDAEGSWSPDGRFVLYTHVDVETRDADIWVYDTESSTHTPLVVAPGYDGGPFFSPDGKRITYRSDRRGDKQLQVFVATLAWDDGAITGIVSETALTDNEHVNWAPFFHPSGSFLVFTASIAGHYNYEVYAIESRGIESARGAVLRVTHTAGFDGLPVFDPTGEWMMWTAQRDGTEERDASSQLWIARFDEKAFSRAYAMEVWRSREAPERPDDGS